MTRATLRTSLLVMLLGFSAMPALADQTVIFNVPIQISHFSTKLKKLRVSCFISSTPSIRKPLAFKWVDIRFRGDGYQGVVHVPVTVRKVYVSRAKYWECEMGLYANDGGICYLGVDAPHDECKLKPGAPLKTRVTGQLKLHSSMSRRNSPHSTTPFIRKTPAPSSR